MTETIIIATAGVPLVTVSREFEAPVELVFRAYTDPELLVRWLGPRELELTVERYETVDAGRWRYVHRDPEGNEHGFHGVFHGEPSTEQIVQTFEYEGVPGHVKLDTTTFETRGDKTLVVTVSSFPSVEDRDGMVASGMERGARDSAERLDALLKTLTTTGEQNTLEKDPHP
jgi:uncharacterized protein YndB with AHSA1/START domain